MSGDWWLFILGEIFFKLRFFFGGEMCALIPLKIGRIQKSPCKDYHQRRGNEKGTARHLMLLVNGNFQFE